MSGSWLPLPLPLGDLTAIQLPDGKWYEVHTETMSIGPLVFTSTDGGDIRTGIMAISADVVEIDLEAQVVGEKPFRLTCRLDCITAIRH